MCGIAGIVDWSGRHPADQGLLDRMITLLQHRGPDECGTYAQGEAGLASARLSVLDLEGGRQPILNETGTLWIACNGEIFNHVELRPALERAGHRFTTQTDIEVILHLYETLGPACLELLNGQFAIAIWDSRRHELFLARDRVGICPLYYVQFPGGLAFASEVKALLQLPWVEAALDPVALAETFTFWAPQAPRTAFRDILELPPAHYLVAREDETATHRYWSLAFPPAGTERVMAEDEAAGALLSLLEDATRLRLRADVPVGSYLSGGLDSTLVTALVRKVSPGLLCTFSLAFSDRGYDERLFQEMAVDALGTAHRTIECSPEHVAQAFPAVIWHAEAPLLRTSPAPLYHLSQLVHESGFKVVLTGEGADEFLGGYNIFKENRIRRFWARDPDSQIRPLLLRRLYPYVSELGQANSAYLQAFFGQALVPVDQPAYSHLLRWRNTARQQRFFSAELRGTLKDRDPLGAFLARLDGQLATWDPLAQAQYLEVTTFMSPYLLSSQGDRMLAAHSVEGRFPFLDHRVIEFANQLPPHYKLHRLREKHLLKRCAADLVPEPITRRAKQPYRAPIRAALFADPPEYVEALLAPEALRDSGYFAPEAVAHLASKARTASHVSEGEMMALTGILSTQLLHHLFIADAVAPHETKAPTLIERSPSAQGGNP